MRRRRSSPPTRASWPASSAWPSFAQTPSLAVNPRRARSWRLLRLACDAGAVGLLTPTLALVAAGLGAYGPRMVAAMLPHGPLELVAFTLGLTLYLEARRQPVPLARALPRAATALALLAAAALLETYAEL